MRLWRTILCVLTTVRGSLADQHPVNDFEGYQSGVYGDPPSQQYQSSNIISPVFSYNTWRKELLTGDKNSHLFLTLDYVGSGPYIFRDDDLSLVYADPAFDYAMNARVQTFDGNDYLTFWHGAPNHGDSQGFCVFYDRHYRLAFNVTLGPPFIGDADMHECEITADGTVLLTAYQDKPFDLTALGGKIEDVLADSCFQEVDIRTNRVVFSWCASDWFEPGLGFWNFSGPSRERNGDPISSDSTSTGFDAYHINSLQKVKGGNYFISLRNLKLLTFVDGATGKPIWNLGGTVNDFVDVTPASVLARVPDSGGALSFGWQHHARVLDDELTQITMFDNHQLINALDCNGSGCSRGRHIQINASDLNNLTVQLARDYRSPHGLSSAILGSMQALHDLSYTGGAVRGSFLVGWGISSEFDEYTDDGELVRDVQYWRLDPEHSFVGSGSVSSYRVFKQSWHGYPTWPPDLAITEDGTLWVSWNGATEVHSWAVYGNHRSDLLGPESGSWSVQDTTLAAVHPLRTVARQGFESEIQYGAAMSAFVKVAALNAEGDVIGTTRTLETGYSPSVSSCLLQDTMSFTCLIRLLV